MTIINVNSISGINSITAQGASGIEFYDSSGNSVQTVTGDGLTVGTGATISGSTNVITASTNGEERVSITSGGNVGINDNNPTTKLDVNGDIGIREGNNLTWHDTNGTPSFRIRSGSDNILHFERASNSATQMIIDNGNVGIGTDNPEGVIHTFGSTNNHLVLESPDSNVDINGADTGGSTRIRSSGGQLSFYTGGDASAHNASNSSLAATINTDGNLVFPDGQGIDFSAVAGSGALTNGSILHDYEEGTWTPSFNAGGTLSIHGAHYTRIGRMVNVYFYIHSIASIPNNATQFEIGGLPFTSLNGQYYPGGVIGYTSTFDASPWIPLVSNNSTKIYFHRIDGSSDTAKNSNFTGIQSFLLNVTYVTNT